MSLMNAGNGNDPLRRYATRVVDHLQNARPRTLQRLVTDVLAGLGRRLKSEHVHLFSVRQPTGGVRTASLKVAWAQSGAELPVRNLRQIPLTLFSNGIAEMMIQGKPAFVPYLADRNGRSRLLSGLILETGCSGYVLCPIHFRKRLCGILGIAHNHGERHIQRESVHQLMLIGRLMVQSIRSVRREARYRRKHHQWKKIADASCDFGLSIDQSGEIRSVIPFGRQYPSMIVGLQLADFFSLRDIADLKRLIEQAVTRQEPRTIDARIIGVGGTEAWYHVRVEPHMASQQHQVTLYLSDIDQRRAQHEELQSLRDHLHRASRLSLLGQISTEFAHQINQPLQAILTLCETMLRRERRRTANREKRQKSLLNILAAVEQASSIVIRIREFAQRRTLRRAPHDLSAIIQRAVMIARPRAEECGVQLLDQTYPQQSLSRSAEVNGHAAADSELDADDCTVYVDDVQTAHVLINLIVNAVEACSQFGRADSLVTVSMQRYDDQQYWLVQVCDNGPGLPSNDPDVVFQKFRTTKSEGLGMGLAISRSVIEAQHGRLWATNNSDRGCTFSFTCLCCAKKLSDTDEMRIVDPTDLPID